MMKKQKKKQDAEETVAEETTQTEGEATEAQEATEEQKTEKADDAEAKLRRAMADLANIRKRHATELGEARSRAIEVLTAELLPVLDNFYLALQAQDNATELSDDVKMMFEGLKMVRSLFEGTLERHGLAEIPTAGATFDPNVHEAVGVDTESDAAPGTITSVMQRGYRFNDKILRASRVIVAGEPAADDSSDDESGRED